MGKKDEEQVEQEYTNDSGETRRIRVYDRNGDFFLDVPPGVRMTFGYFNPGQTQSGNRYGRDENERKTALRIYGDTTDKRQLACFLGVSGFRDESIKLTKLVQKVTIENRLVDDGEGTVEYGGKQLRELTASPEAEFGGESVPF